MTKLQSSDGHRWAFMRRHDIPDLLTPQTYLRRWRIVQTPWGGLYLHKIMLPDSDRHLHDHPWNFTSLILKGGYIERREGRVCSESCKCNRGEFLAFAVNRVKATDAHAIVHLLWGQPVWSLVLVGRRQRDWGYHTEEGWIDHDAYHFLRQHSTVR